MELGNQAINKLSTEDTQDSHGNMLTPKPVEKQVLDPKLDLTHIPKIDQGKTVLGEAQAEDQNQLSEFEDYQPNARTANRTLTNSSLNFSAAPILEETYEILGRIGKGGMGEVLKVRKKDVIGDNGPERAAKICKLNDPIALQRFNQEVLICLKLTSQGFAKVNEIIRTKSGEIGYVMDLIQGANFIHIINAYHEISKRDAGGKNLSPETKEVMKRFFQTAIDLTDTNKFSTANKDKIFFEITRMFISICKSVSIMHGKNIIHRDLKPENILVEEASNTPIILDLGLAKEIDSSEQATVQDQSRNSTTNMFTTQHGVTLGTPQYMAPEQATGQVTEHDIPTDIYCLGAMLYFIVTGKQAIETYDLKSQKPKDRNQFINDIATSNIESPKRLTGWSLFADLQAIISKTIKNNPQERYQNVNELIQDLENLLTGNNVNAYIEAHKFLNYGYRVAKLAQRNIGFTTLLICSLIAVTGKIAYNEYIESKANDSIKSLKSTNGTSSSTLDSLKQITKDVQELLNSESVTHLTVDQLESINQKELLAKLELAQQNCNFIIQTISSFTEYSVEAEKLYKETVATQKYLATQKKEILQYQLERHETLLAYHELITQTEGVIAGARVNIAYLPQNPQSEGLDNYLKDFFKLQNLNDFPNSDLINNFTTDLHNQKLTTKEKNKVTLLAYRLLVTAASKIPTSRKNGYYNSDDASKAYQLIQAAWGIEGEKNQRNRQTLLIMINACQKLGSEKEQELNKINEQLSLHQATNSEDYCRTAQDANLEQNFQLAIDACLKSIELSKAEEDLLGKDPSGPRLSAYTEIIHAHIRLYQFESALPYFGECYSLLDYYDLNPEYKNSLMGKISYYHALTLLMAYERQNNLKNGKKDLNDPILLAAIAKLEVAIILEPDNYMYNFTLCQIENQKLNFKAAIESANRVIELNSNYTPTYPLLADSYLRIGEFEKMYDNIHKWFYVLEHRTTSDLKQALQYNFVELAKGDSDQKINLLKRVNTLITLSLADAILNEIRFSEEPVLQIQITEAEKNKLDTFALNLIRVSIASHLASQRSFVPDFEKELLLKLKKSLEKNFPNEQELIQKLTLIHEKLSPPISSE